MTMQEHNEEVRFQIGEVTLAGTLGIPEHALGMVLFAHGSGSSRHSPRNRFVAATLRKAGLGTLLFDLLTKDEETEDLVTGRMRFDIPLLAGRLLGATDWLAQNPATEGVRIGYFGSSTGGAAALIASVERLEKIGAIVCRGSRTDMAKVVLACVAAPTLLIVGERDETVLEWNRESYLRNFAAKSDSRSFRPQRIFLKNPTRSKKWRGLPRSGFGGGSRPVPIDQPTCRNVQSAWNGWQAGHSRGRGRTPQGSAENH